MIQIKDGADVRGLHAKIWDAVYLIHPIYQGFGVDLVITAGLDGTHKYASLHYIGCAVDLRTRNLEAKDVQTVYEQIQNKLNAEYDVVLHSTHIHVEYQPKTQRGL